MDHQSPALRFHLERVAAIDVSSICCTDHLMGKVGSHISAGPAEGAAIYASRVGTA
jgi:ApbE superfamily uncharacterized protein (UPF0280 family)